MSTMNIENGQTIDQLNKLTDLNSKSLLLGTKDGITGQVTVAELGKAICADNVKENKDSLYYSAKEIDRQLDDLKALIVTNSNIPEEAINNRINLLQETINAKINSLESSIEYIKSYLKI